MSPTDTHARYPRFLLQLRKQGGWSTSKAPCGMPLMSFGFFNQRQYSMGNST